VYCIVRYSEVGSKVLGRVESLQKSRRFN